MTRTQINTLCALADVAPGDDDSAYTFQVAENLGLDHKTTYRRLGRLVTQGLARKQRAYLPQTSMIAAYWSLTSAGRLALENAGKR